MIRRNANLLPEDGDAEVTTSRRADLERFERAVHRLWTPLVAYALRLLDDRAEAEDVVQRALVRIWERHHVLPPDEELRPFLYRVVRNLALNELRRTRTRVEWLGDVSHDDALSPAPLTPDQLLHGRELAAAIGAAIEQLPARRREVFVLSRYHALSNAQIAEVLEISPQTVANQLVNALRDLREMLAPWLTPAEAPELRIVRSERRFTG